MKLKCKMLNAESLQTLMGAKEIVKESWIAADGTYTLKAYDELKGMFVKLIRYTPDQIAGVLNRKFWELVDMDSGDFTERAILFFD